MRRLLTLSPTQSPTFIVKRSNDEGTPVVAISLAVCLVVVILLGIFLIARNDENACKRRKRVRVKKRAESEVDEVDLETAVVDPAFVKKNKLSEEGRMNRTSIALRMKKYKAKNETKRYARGGGQTSQTDIELPKNMHGEIDFAEAIEVRAPVDQMTIKQRIKERKRKKSINLLKPVIKDTKTADLKVGKRLKDFLARANLGQYAAKISQAGYENDEQLRRAFQSDPGKLTADMKRIVGMKSAEVLELRILLSQQKQTSFSMNRLLVDTRSDKNSSSGNSLQPPKEKKPQNMLYQRNDTDQSDELEDKDSFATAFTASFREISKPKHMQQSASSLPALREDLGEMPKNLPKRRVPETAEPKPEDKRGAIRKKAPPKKSAKGTPREIRQAAPVEESITDSFYGMLSFGAPAK